MANKPSIYQKVIFDWIKNGKGNAVIQAVAGSGKTTTIVAATNLIPVDKRCVFVAFNKAIADELSAKVPKHISAKTLHSLGLSLFRDNEIQTKVDSNKLYNLINNELDNNDSFERNDNFTFLKRIIPHIKNSLIDYTNFEQLEDLKTKYDITDEITDSLMINIKNIMKRNNDMLDVIDFDDMIYLPVVKKFKVNTYDWILVDESQDLNRTQFEFIKMLCSDNTRVVAVGDKRQSIYGFRGADTNSMDNFINEFKATELPLSICYRCPTSHIQLAQEIVPEIEASETAIEGLVQDINLSEALDIANEYEKDLILCRTNAPLIKVAFALIRQGKKAVIRGRDIGANLIKMINKYKASNIEELYEKLQTFQDLEEKKLALIEKGKYDSKKKNMILSNIDSTETLFAIMEDCQFIEQIKTKIETIFSDNKEGIICSSVHRAKGLQSNRVFIINREKMPHPMAQTKEEIEQEYNILYVALTRSTKELYFIIDKM